MPAARHGTVSRAVLTIHARRLYARDMFVRAFCVLLVVVPAVAAQPKKAKKRILFVTHSAGYMHQVVRRRHAGALSLAEKELDAFAGKEFEVVTTQDSATIRADTLSRYAAIVFYTTGELPINARALVDYVRGGGGFVGIHCAADTFYKFAPYGKMIGGYFNGHPWHQKGRRARRGEGPSRPRNTSASGSRSPTRSTSSATGTGATCACS